MNFVRFVKGRLKSFVYAARGAYILINTEHSVMVQVVVAVAITIMGFIFKISQTEWILQTLAIGLVIGTEGLNTAIEKIADFIHPDYNDKIGTIKDVAAGAVFVVAVCAVAIGMMIYLPKFF
ncbi:MAG: diacylglycerol kinase family protein [Flavobacteriaceae bacterium]|nr:diacylglycerol kinase family protein [Flavobacteriaceae bacterium]